MMASLLKTKFPWVLCTIFSVIYFILFTQVSTANPTFDETGLIGGFCVWGNPAVDPINGCKNNNNSHMYSWYEDAFFTMIVVGAYFYGKKQDSITYLALGGIILFHGLLHFYLSTELDCSTELKDQTDAEKEKTEEIGWFLYTIFAFFLSFVIFGLGFLKTKQVGPLLVLLASGLVTLLTYNLAHKAGTNWLLSTLFATSHPIASVTGLGSKSPLFTNLQGWLFLAATLDGIVELKFCESFLKQYGGHVFYDFFLHMAVIVALPVFQKDANKQKTN
jgi:hypothetical protein